MSARIPKNSSINNPSPDFRSAGEAAKYITSYLNDQGIAAKAMQFGNKEFGIQNSEDRGWQLVLGNNEETRLKFSYDPETGIIGAGNALFTRAYTSSQFDSQRPLGSFLRPHELAARMIADSAKISINAPRDNSVSFGDAFSAITDPMVHLGISRDVRDIPRDERNWYGSALMQFYPDGMSSREVQASAAQLGRQDGYIPVHASQMSRGFVPTDDETRNPGLLTKIKSAWANTQYSVNFSRFLSNSPAYSIGQDGTLLGWGPERDGKQFKDATRLRRERWEINTSIYPNMGESTNPQQILIGALMQNPHWQFGEGRGAIGDLHNVRAETIPQPKSLPIDSSLELSKLQINEKYRDIPLGQGVDVPWRGATLASIGDNEIGIDKTNFGYSNVGRLYLSIGAGDSVINQLTGLLGSEHRKLIEKNFSRATPDSQEGRDFVLGMVNEKFKDQGLTAMFGEGKTDGISLSFLLNRETQQFSLKNIHQKLFPTFNKELTPILKQERVDYAMGAQDFKNKPAAAAAIVQGVMGLLDKDENGNYIYGDEAKYGRFREVANRIAGATEGWKKRGIGGMELVEKQFEMYYQNAPTMVDPNSGVNVPLFPIMTPGAVVEYPGDGKVGYDTIHWMDKLAPETAEWMINKGVENNPYIRFKLASEGSPGVDVVPPREGVGMQKGLSLDDRLRQISTYVSDKVDERGLISVSGVSLPGPKDVMRAGTSGMRRAYGKLFGNYDQDLFINDKGITSKTQFQGYREYPVDEQMKDNALAARKEIEMHLSGNYGANINSRKEIQSLYTPSAFSGLIGDTTLEGWTGEFGRRELDRFASELNISPEQLAKMGSVPMLITRPPESKHPLAFNMRYNPNLETGFSLPMAASIALGGDYDRDPITGYAMFDMRNGKPVTAPGFDDLLASQGDPEAYALRVLSAQGTQKEFDSKYAELEKIKGSAPTPHDMLYGIGKTGGLAPELQGTKQNVLNAAIQDSAKFDEANPLKGLGNPNLTRHAIGKSDLIEQGLNSIQAKNDMGGLNPVRSLFNNLSKQEVQEAANKAFPDYGSGMRKMGAQAGVGEQYLTPGSQLSDRIFNLYQIALDSAKSPMPSTLKGYNYEWLSRWDDPRAANKNIGSIAVGDFREAVGSGYGDPEELAMMFSRPDPESQRKIADYVRGARSGGRINLTSGEQEIIANEQSPYGAAVASRVSTLLRNSAESGQLEALKDGNYRLKRGKSVITQGQLDKVMQMSETPGALFDRISARRGGWASSFLQAMNSDGLYKRVFDAAAAVAHTIFDPKSAHHGPTLNRSLGISRQSPDAEGIQEQVSPEAPPVVEAAPAASAPAPQVDVAPPAPPPIAHAPEPPATTQPLKKRARKSSSAAKPIPQSEPLAQPVLSPPPETEDPLPERSPLNQRMADIRNEEVAARQAQARPLEIGGLETDPVMAEMRRLGRGMDKIQKRLGINANRGGQLPSARYNAESVANENAMWMDYLDENGKVKMSLTKIEEKYGGAFYSLDDNQKAPFKQIDLHEKGMLTSKAQYGKLLERLNYQASKAGWTSQGTLQNGSMTTQEMEAPGLMRAAYDRISKEAEAKFGKGGDSKDHPMAETLKAEIDSANKALSAFRDAIGKTTDGTKEQADAVRKLTPGLHQIASRLDDATGVKGVSKALPNATAEAQALEHQARGTLLPQAQGGLIPDSTWNLLSEDEQKQLGKGARRETANIVGGSGARTGEKLLSALFAMQTIRSLRYTFNPIIEGANEYAVNEGNLLGMYSQATGLNANLNQQSAVLRANTSLSNIRFGIGQNASQVVSGAGQILDNSNISGGGPLGYLASVGSPAFGVGMATTLAVSSASMNPAIGLAAGAVTGGLTLLGGMAAYQQGAKNDKNALIRSDILSSMGYSKGDIANIDTPAYVSTEGGGLNPFFASFLEGFYIKTNPKLAAMSTTELTEWKKKNGNSPFDGVRTNFSAPGQNVIDRLNTSPFDWSGLTATEIEGMMESSTIQGTPLSNVMESAGLKDSKKKMSALVMAQTGGSSLDSEGKKRLSYALAASEASVLSGGGQFQQDLASKLAEARGDSRWNAWAKILADNGAPISTNDAMKEIGAWQMVGGRLGISNFNAITGKSMNIGQYGDMVAGMTPQEQIGLQMFQQASPQMLSRMNAKYGYTVPGLGNAGTFTMDSFNSRGLFEISAFGTPGISNSYALATQDNRGVSYQSVPWTSQNLSAIQSAWGLSASGAAAFSGQTYNGVGGITALNWYMRDNSYNRQMQQYGLEAAGAAAQHDFSINVSRPMERANFQMSQASLWGGSVNTAWGTYDAGAGKFAWEKQSMAISLGDLNASYAQQQARIGWNYQDISRQEYQNTARASWQRQDFSLQSQQIGIHRQMQAYDYGYSVQSLNLQRSYMEQDYSYNQQMRNLQFGWNMEDFDINIRRATGFQRRQLLKEKGRAEQAFSLEGGQLERVHDRQEEQFKREEQHMKTQRQYALELNKIEDQNFKNSKERFEQENKWREEQFGIERSRLGEQSRWAAEAHERSIAGFKIRAEQLAAEESSAKVNAAMTKERMDAQFKLEDQLYAIQMAKIGLAQKEATEAHLTQVAIEKMVESAKQASSLLPKMMDDVAFSFIDDIVQYMNKMLGGMGAPLIPSITRNTSHNQTVPPGAGGGGTPPEKIENKAPARRLLPASSTNSGSGDMVQVIQILLDGKDIGKGVVKGLPNALAVKARTQYPNAR